MSIETAYRLAYKLREMAQGVHTENTTPLLLAAALLEQLSSQDVKPSYFATLGHPNCSCWGKSEIEWIAHAYVLALATDGDTWKRLTKEQTLQLVVDFTKDKTREHSAQYMLERDFSVYNEWFNAVADKLVDAAGAFSVGGWWNKKPS